MLKIMDDTGRELLTRAVNLARRTYGKYSQDMYACAKAGGNELISVESAQAMGDDHATTAEQFNELLKVLERTDEIRLIVTEDGTEDED